MKRMFDLAQLVIIGLLAADTYGLLSPIISNISMFFVYVYVVFMYCIGIIVIGVCLFIAYLIDEYGMTKLNIKIANIYTEQKYKQWNRVTSYLFFLIFAGLFAARESYVMASIVMFYIVLLWVCYILADHIKAKILEAASQTA